MFPLIPSMALAIFSFICSAFVILRIVIPILPPHPLSRRVAPSEFGLPNFRSLSAADKSHLWLASLDLLALAMILWQVIMESLGGPTGLAIAEEPAASIRVWLAMTVRQTCLLMVAAITLLHVRLGRSVSFGTKHWMLWAPTALLIVTSTAIAGVVAGAGATTLFTGLIAYSSTIAVLSSLAFGCLVGTLLIIKRNLAALHEEDQEPWQIEEKPRPSFATEDVDVLRDGASWITSTAGSSSERGSISGWSFSTHVTSTHGHGGRPQGPHNPSVPGKSSFWFGSSTTNVANVPPVPPLPSTYGPLSPTAAQLSDPDPFRRESPSPLLDHPRQRLGSQTSWLTSTNGDGATLSAWSFPGTQRDDISEHSHSNNGSTTNLQTTLLPSGTGASRPVTPAMSSAQVLGGYGYHGDTEKNLTNLAAATGSSLEISIWRAVGWLVIIWIPMALSYPFMINTVTGSSPSFASSIMLVLSLTLSSPILALNILLRSPIPIPDGLFDIRGQLPTELLRAPSRMGGTPVPKFSSEYKRSTSTNATVVEGRRSGDVWLANGDAVEGKGKVGRALEMLSPRPKLSVLPPQETDDEAEAPPPLRMEDPSVSLSIQNTPQSETSEQFGRIRKDSKASSHFSGADASMAYASQIMIAQRHYSTLARTMMVSTSPEKATGAAIEEGDGIDEDGNFDIDEAVTSAIRRVSTGGHLRARSVSSIVPQSPTERSAFAPSPPPSFPLPPTPPSVRIARLAQHKKSYSSGFSFGAVDDLNEIDALTAGVLPILVPGLNVGKDMKITENLEFNRKNKAVKKPGRKIAMGEFGHGSGDEFSSPEFHSTPARTKAALTRARKESHKRNHFSLPSLGLGKDGVHTLAVEIGRALENYVATPNNIDVGRRATVFGADSMPSYLPTATGGLQAVPEELQGARLGRALSTRTLGLRAEVPHNIDTARSSVITFDRPLPSAASTATLFEFGKDLDGIDFMKDLENGEGPVAESTPHNERAGRYTTQAQNQDEVPPLPSIAASRAGKEKRRSSIVYIKSDENTPPPAVSSDAGPSYAVTRMQSFVRAVRPLVTKKKTPKSATPSPQGLRPLSLLQNRDLNASMPPAPLSAAGSGKAKKQIAPLDLSASRHGRRLTPEAVVRTNSSRARGAMLDQENLPDVHVRPPSHTEHQPFAYSFRR